GIPVLGGWSKRGEIWIQIGDCAPRKSQTIWQPLTNLERYKQRRRPAVARPAPCARQRRGHPLAENRGPDGGTSAGCDRARDSARWWPADRSRAQDLPLSLTPF